jgi:hypothetical protein
MLGPTVRLLPHCIEIEPERVHCAVDTEWQADRPPAPSYLRILYLGKILQDEDTLTSASLLLFSNLMLTLRSQNSPSPHTPPHPPPLPSPSHHPRPQSCTSPSGPTPRPPTTPPRRSPSPSAALVVRARLRGRSRGHPVRRRQGRRKRARAGAVVSCASVHDCTVRRISPLPDRLSPSTRMRPSSPCLIRYPSRFPASFPHSHANLRTTASSPAPPHHDPLLVTTPHCDHLRSFDPIRRHAMSCHAGDLLQYVSYWCFRTTPMSSPRPPTNFGTSPTRHPSMVSQAFHCVHAAGRPRDLPFHSIVVSVSGSPRLMYEARRGGLGAVAPGWRVVRIGLWVRRLSAHTRSEYGSVRQHLRMPYSVFCASVLPLPCGVSYRRASHRSAPAAGYRWAALT